MQYCSEVLPGQYSQGVKVIAWDDFMRMGEERAVEPRPPRPDDPATIMCISF